MLHAVVRLLLLGIEDARREFEIKVLLNPIGIPALHPFHLEWFDEEARDGADNGSDERADDRHEP